MEKLNYEHLNEELVNAAPELKPAYEQEIEWWEGEKPSPHNVFGSVLNSFLLSLDAEEVSQHSDVLQRIFELLERMAEHPENSDIQGVLTSTVLYQIVDPERLEWLARMREYMGTETLRLARTVASDFGRHGCLKVLGGPEGSQIFAGSNGGMGTP